MNNSSIQARRVSDPELVNAPGDYFFIPHSSKPDTFWLMMWLPGEVARGSWRVRRVEKVADPGYLASVPIGTELCNTWLWNGDEDKPTLVPSLEHTGIWHGHFTNGEMRSC